MPWAHVAAGVLLELTAAVGAFMAVFGSADEARFAERMSPTSVPR